MQGLYVCTSFADMSYRLNVALFWIKVCEQSFPSRRADLINGVAEKYIQYAYGDPLPTVKRDLDGKLVGLKVLSTKADARRVDMTAEEFLLMPAKLYGFSLGDRKWRTSVHCLHTFSGI